MTFMMFALLLVEILAIRKDRREHDEQVALLLREEVAARGEAKTNFQGIGAGIQSTIEQSKKDFDGTMERTKSIIDLQTTTITGIGEGLKTVTGGDSFCIATVAYDSPQNQDDGLFQLFHKGKFPLHGLNVRIADLEQLKELAKGKTMTVDLAYEASMFIHYGDMPGYLVASALRKWHFSPLGDRRDFDVMFDALNGYWKEEFRQSRVNGNWYFALRVKKFVGYEKGTRNPKYEVIYENIEPEFPLVSGEVDWDRSY